MENIELDLPIFTEELRLIRSEMRAAKYPLWHELHGKDETHVPEVHDMRRHNEL